MFTDNRSLIKLFLAVKDRLFFRLLTTSDNALNLNWLHSIKPTALYSLIDN